MGCHSNCLGLGKPEKEINKKWSHAQIEFVKGVVFLVLTVVPIKHLVSKTIADAPVDSTGALALIGSVVGIGFTAAHFIRARREQKAKAAQSPKLG